MAQRKPTITVQELLTVYASDPTKFIGNNPAPIYDPQYGHNIPMFNKWIIPTMLRDGRVRFALQMLKGPIQYNTVFIPQDKSSNPALIDLLKANGAEFIYKVSADSPDVEQFAVSTLKRFWNVGLDEALSAIEWGFSCSQVIYKNNKEKNNIEYDYLKWNHPDSVKPLFKERGLVGACLKGVPKKENGVDLFFPKVLWHIHNRKVNSVFGESRLEWCSIPWHELYVCYGARDIRRTWFQKNAFDGGEMRYPIGKTKIGEVEIDNLELAVKMMSNMRTGGFRVFPDDINATSGAQKWTYMAPSANTTPQGLMEYPEKLRYEILEAMGIPPEVTESQNDNGMGSATGRKVPMMLYYSTLAHLADMAIYDFKLQVLDYLTFINYKTKNVQIERVALEDAMQEGQVQLDEQGNPIEQPQIPEGGSTPIVQQTEENTQLQV